MSCLASVDWNALAERFAPARAAAEWAVTALGAFGLVSLAEIGDKSQLVCMSLAARHRALPVIAGATCAFAVLNLAAVLFGAAAARWLPLHAVETATILLFAFFGLRALFAREEDEDAAIRERDGRNVFASAFLLIFVAEFGDKTQLAAAGMSATAPPGAVWLGATLGLAFVSALGAWAGRALLRRVPPHWLHRVGGLLFLGFAFHTAWHSSAAEWITRLLRP